MHKRPPAIKLTMLQVSWWIDVTEKLKQLWPLSDSCQYNDQPYGWTPLDQPSGYVFKSLLSIQHILQTFLAGNVSKLGLLIYLFYFFFFEKLGHGRNVSCVLKLLNNGSLSRGPNTLVHFNLYHNTSGDKRAHFKQWIKLIYKILFG